MAKVKLKQPTKKLTPQRTMEVADSLNKQVYNKFQTAKDAKRLGYESQGESMIKSGMNDLYNAARYKSLALKAINKNK